MKAIDLAEKLLVYPDFEVQMTISDGITDGSHIPWPNIRTFKIEWGDIGHSDKIINLDGVEQ
jgi:hypothetical protein